MGLLNVVKLLVEKGAEVNGMANEGGTPLHTAAYFGQRAVVYFLLERGAVAVIADSEGTTPLHLALTPWEGEPDVELICKMLLPSGALVDIATDVVDAHEKRQKRIVKGLKRAVRSPGFLEDLADTLAGIDALGCAEGSGAMLMALLRQLDAFAGNAGDKGAGRVRVGETGEILVRGAAAQIGETRHRQVFARLGRGRGGDGNCIAYISARADLTVDQALGRELFIGVDRGGARHGLILRQRARGGQAFAGA